jgi:hypothetical protein
MEFGDRPPDPGLPYYKTIKTSLASVLKTPGKQPVISQAAATVNNIVTRSLLFLRLYLIHQKATPPTVNADFIDTVFKTVCHQKAIGRPPSATAKALRDKLTAFYKQHFEPLLPEGDQPISYTYLNTVLDYASVQLVVRWEQYIDDLSADETEGLKQKAVVGIDPNMSDLLYCVNEDASKQYRYTQNQRRQETKVKKYRQIMLNEKNHTTVEGRSIIEWESNLSTYDRKTVDSDRFKAFIKAKLLVNSKVTDFYEGRLYRKMRLNTFYNTRKSEQGLVQRFKEIFGTPEEAVIGIGDWEQRKHRKFKEPVKGKGFRTLLRKAGYSVFLVDEFRTSCQCSHCQSEGAKCEKFRVRLDPNTKKATEDRHLRLVHGLLLCQQCNRLWNRDVNSSINIARLTRQALEGRGRPDYLSRQTQLPRADSAVASTA